MANVVWRNGVRVPAVLHFEDLAVGDSFKYTRGRGAVYMKVVREHTSSPDKFYQLELATGNLFHGSAGPVIKVPVTINVDVDKPNLYR